MASDITSLLHLTYILLILWVAFFLEYTPIIIKLASRWQCPRVTAFLTKLRVSSSSVSTISRKTSEGWWTDWPISCSRGWSISMRETQLCKLCYLPRFRRSSMLRSLSNWSCSRRWRRVRLFFLRVGINKYKEGAIRNRRSMSCWKGMGNCRKGWESWVKKWQDRVRWLIRSVVNTIMWLIWCSKSRKSIKNR